MLSISQFMGQSGGAQRQAFPYQPGSNGFFNRRLFMEPGAHSFVVPAGVTKIKAAVFGGGGSGALVHSNFLNALEGGYRIAYGGGGGGYSEKEFDVVPGQLINITVGAGGDGLVSAGAAPFYWNGNIGGTTTISIDGQIVLQATGGQGGVIADLDDPISNADTQGGEGSLGDFNAKGGGCNPHVYALTTVYSDRCAPMGGGGSSGSPMGDGRHGECGEARTSSGYSLSDMYGGGGGGWGSDGSRGSVQFNSSAPEYHSLGGGTLSDASTMEAQGTSTPNGFEIQYILGRKGLRASDIQPRKLMLNTGSQYSTFTDCFMLELEAWWDFSDFGGWGAGYNFNAGPGGGASTNGAAGFGGGGSGGYSNISFTNAGTAAGGGGRYVNGTQQIGGKGGDGCVAIWW